MKYEVISESNPETHVNILKCKVRKWHSFISGSTEFKEYLAMSGSKAPSNNLEVYESPGFIMLSNWETNRMWSAMKRFRAKRDKNKATNTFQEKYGEYFEEPQKPSKNYRDNPNV